MNQQSYILTTNYTPIDRNWPILEGEETEDINNPPTPGLAIGNSNKSLRLGLLTLDIFSKQEDLNRLAYAWVKDISIKKINLF